MLIKKQIFALTFALLGTALLTNAQNFSAGFAAGINASQISGDTYGGFDKAGIVAGFFANVKLSEKFYAQMELNYSQKGSRRNPNTDEGDTEFFLLRLNYIEAPLMIKYDYKRFTVESGVYYGRLIHEHIEDENGVFQIPSAFNDFKSFDFGVLAGINFNLTEQLIMNWRYNGSVIPVRDYDSGENFRFDSGMFNTFLSFTVRYQFIRRDA